MAEETKQVISQLGYGGEVYDIRDDEAHKRLDELNNIEVVTTIGDKYNKLYVVYEIESPKDVKQTVVIKNTNTQTEHTFYIYDNSIDYSSWVYSDGNQKALDHYGKYVYFYNLNEWGDDLFVYDYYEDNMTGEPKTSGAIDLSACMKSAQTKHHIKNNKCENHE